MKTTLPIKHADACYAATVSSVIAVTMSARIKRRYQTGAEDQRFEFKFDYRK